MGKVTHVIEYDKCSFEELSEGDRLLVTKAKEACRSSYAPYSNFHVGAAVLLDNGEVVTGSNQENAASPSGTCAERCTMFYANARFPESAPVAIAIAAINQAGEFTPSPITPCGACRQVLTETQHRYGKPLRVILYGGKYSYCFDDISGLLPFQFDAEAL